MDISASDLRVFETVALEGSVTSGASRLGLTQPAVTRSLQKLERELQAELFIRSRKGVVLTRAGRHLSASAKRLLADFERIHEGLKEGEQELQGVYSIGVHSDLAGHTLPKFVASLLRDHPRLELRFEHDLSRKITEQVASLELDFGLVVNPYRYPDLTIHRLYRDQVGFWVSKHSPWRQDFSSSRVPIVCNRELTQTMKLLKQIKKQKLFPEPRLVHTTNHQLIADLTASQAGLGIIPETEALLHNKKNLHHLCDLPIHRDEICLVYRKDALRGTAGAEIKDAIVQALKV